MRHIDFWKRKRDLHNDILCATMELMREHNVKRINLLESNVDKAFVVISVDGAESTAEIEVREVVIVEDCLYVNTNDDYGFEGDLFDLSTDGDVMWCTINDVYESVYQAQEKSY